MRQDASSALAADFPGARLADWEMLAAKALRGAPLDRLVRRTRDGIAVAALCTRADAGTLGAAAGLPGASPFVRGAGAAGTLGGWDVRQRQAHPDPVVANRQILDDLAGGATSVALRLDAAATLGGADPDDGVVVLDLADLEQALEGVHLDLAPVALDAGARFAEAATLLLALLERRDHPADAVRASLGADPLGAALRGGAIDPEAGLARAVALARRVAGSRPGLSTMLADGRPWHAAGATEAQELAAVVATAVYYLRALEAGGLGLGTAAGQIGFTLAVDADFFLSVAKLRALRRLWGRVLEASGVRDAAAGMRLHAETGTRMYARRDPWVNMLRGTVACFAAAAGGADGVTVLPFDHALGLPSPLARRVARNTQLILQEESNLHRVLDPAGGAWHVEGLTRDLAHRAWDLFREIEAGGGMLAALRAGTPQGWVAATRAERARDLAAREEPVTGVSEFPDLGERPVAPEQFDAASLTAATQRRLTGAVAIDDIDALVEAARAGKVLGTPAGVASGLAPLPRHRLAEAFEALRDRGDAALAHDGVRRRVFLAALGPPAQHTARLGFARNLLEAGGIEPVASPPLADTGGAVGSFTASGARIAALCSSDEVYADLAVPVASALKAAGCGLVCLMGRPADEEGHRELAAAGVELFVHAGRDMVEVLTGLHDRLGTPAGPQEEPAP